MLILNGQHEKARREIQAVVDEVALTSLPGEFTSLLSLQFYAFRYLGISYHRAVRPDLAKARECFDLAQSFLERLPVGSTDYLALRARLQGNYGNLLLDVGEGLRALALYQSSLELFQKVGDLEHCGIANLDIAKAIIRSGVRKRNPFPILAEAGAAFSQIAWIEGLGRVHEQMAYAYLASAQRGRTTSRSTEYLSKALAEAEIALGIFRRMNSERLCGRIDVLLEDVQRRIAGGSLRLRTAGAAGIKLRSASRLLRNSHSIWWT